MFMCGISGHLAVLHEIDFLVTRTKARKEFSVLNGVGLVVLYVFLAKKNKKVTFPFGGHFENRENVTHH